MVISFPWSYQACLQAFFPILASNVVFGMSRVCQNWHPRKSQQSDSHSGKICCDCWNDVDPVHLQIDRKASMACIILRNFLLQNNMLWNRGLPIHPSIQARNWSWNRSEWEATSVSNLSGFVPGQCGEKKYNKFTLPSAGMCTISVSVEYMICGFGIIPCLST